MYIYFFIFLIFILFYIYQQNINIKYTDEIDHVSTEGWSQGAKRISKIKKSREEKCREIIEEIFQRKFSKIRHELLINPETNRKLELDCYSKLKFKKYYNGLAFEVDGEQHYSFNKSWHKTRSVFNKQIERDKLKNELCKKNGILLIRIPYFIDDIKSFIIKQINLEIFNE